MYLRKSSYNENHEWHVSVSADGGRRLWERYVHPAQATLAQPKRSIDVDDNESSDIVRRSGRRHQDLSERHAADEGLWDTSARPVLSSNPDAEGCDDRHAGGNGQEGELCVTLHPPRGLHLQRERVAVNHAIVNREIAADPGWHERPRKRLGDVYRSREDWNVF